MALWVGSGKRARGREDHVVDQVHDVAIVGMGPVGQTCALLLGRLGYDVVVLERCPQPYRLPRAAPDQSLEALLVRPDFSVYGGVSTIDGLGGLVAELRRSLLGNPAAPATARIQTTTGRLG